MKKITLSKFQVKILAVIALGFFIIPVFAKADYGNSSSYLSTPMSSNSTPINPNTFLQFPSYQEATNSGYGQNSANLSNPFPASTTTTVYPVLTVATQTPVQAITITPPAPVATNSALAVAANVIGVSKVESNVTNDIATGGVTHANGMVLYISDTHARVVQGDTVTFTIQAQNTHSYDVTNANATVQLPDQYQFNNSNSGADYNPQSNVVNYQFGTIPAGTTQSFTFTASAVGNGNGTVQTTATLAYDGGKLSASDHDAYVSGSKSVLGASVFGAGFFPQTFTGWFLILLLIAIIIIVARRYVKAPKPAMHAPVK